MNDSQLAFLRRTYARTVAFASGADDPRLEAAFAEVPREDFLGRGPWDIPVAEGYRRTPDTDLMWLYQNQLVGIVPEKGLNNSHPSFLAMLISLMRLEGGDHAVHIGAGVGYFTAIMASLVGPRGKVSAVEYEPDLAARAKANLA
ncbi:MAG: protein-L-isoaspartate O-methyltransferase family protein, partial [Caulobacteraceae bacterium]